MRGDVSRIVANISPATAAEIKYLAKRLECPQVQVVTLAISLADKLAREDQQGSDLVLERTDGTEVEIWLPTVRRYEKQS